MLPNVKMRMSKETRVVLKNFSSLLTVGELSFSAGIAADIFKAEAKALAPSGTPSRGSDETNKVGNLKDGVVAWIDKTAQFGSVGVAHVGINYKKAPHAHLVEFGTEGVRVPKDSKKLVFYIDGKKIVTDSVKPMPAQPFMRPAIDNKKSVAITELEADLLILINKKMAAK